MSTLCSQALVSVEAILHPRGPSFNAPLVAQVPPVVPASIEQPTHSILPTLPTFNLPKPPNAETPFQSEVQPSTSQGAPPSPTQDVEMDSSPESSDQDEDDEAELTISDIRRIKETQVSSAAEGLSSEVEASEVQDETEDSEQDLGEKEAMVTETDSSKIEPVYEKLQDTLTVKVMSSHPQYDAVSKDAQPSIENGTSLVVTETDAGSGLNINDNVADNNNQTQMKSSQTAEKRKLEETQDDVSATKKLQVNLHINIPAL